MKASEKNLAELTWQLDSPIDAVVFDCDNTLSHIEGIDELARVNQVGPEVAYLTELAMGKVGLNQEIYKRRLELVKPTYQQLINLSEKYIAAQAPNLNQVLIFFKKYNKELYVISAGLNPAVNLFSQHLGIPKNHVFAVDLIFDQQHHYQDFDQNNPLTNLGGKCIILEQIIQHHQRILYVGDGLNDVEAGHLATRFVGYGGAQYRQNIADVCEFYIKAASLLPLLPLGFTQHEVERLSAADRVYYEKGLALIHQQEVKIK